MKEETNPPTASAGGDLSSFAFYMLPSSFFPRVGGEGANRTLLDPQREPTTVLKTARATRHPSLSRKPKRGTLKTKPRTPIAESSHPPAALQCPVFGAGGSALSPGPGEQREAALLQRAERIALRSASGSGNCRDSSFEWSFFPLTVTSKQPPLDGISSRLPICCLSFKSLSARPTA